MTDLQKTFLLYAAIFLLLQGLILACFYVAMLMYEKFARRRQQEAREKYQERRIKEQKDWEVAYKLYEKKVREKNERKANERDRGPDDPPP